MRTSFLSNKSEIILFLLWGLFYKTIFKPSVKTYPGQYLKNVDYVLQLEHILI